MNISLQTFTDCQGYKKLFCITIFYLTIILCVTLIQSLAIFTLDNKLLFRSQYQNSDFKYFIADDKYNKFKYEHYSIKIQTMRKSII